jgi:uncharacterized protein with PIN domain
MENKEAKWIMAGHFRDFTICSNCNFILQNINETPYFSLEPDKDFPICPKCKSKMTN